MMEKEIFKSKNHNSTVNIVFLDFTLLKASVRTTCQRHYPLMLTDYNGGAIGPKKQIALKIINENCRS